MRWDFSAWGEVRSANETPGCTARLIQSSEGTAWGVNVCLTQMQFWSSGQVASVGMPSLRDSQTIRSILTTDFILIFTHIIKHETPIPWGFRIRTPPEGQYSYSIGWTIEYEYEYHFIEYEYEFCPEMWVKMRISSVALKCHCSAVKAAAMATPRRGCDVPKLCSSNAASQLAADVQ